MIRVSIQELRELSPPEYSFQFIGNLPKIEAGGALFGDNHNVGGSGKPCLVQTKEFTKQTFHPVAFDRRPHMLANRDPQSPVGETVGAYAQPEVAGLVFRPISGDSQEIGPATDPLLFSEVVKPHLPRVPISRDGLI